ncbi:hypothetical protein B0H11DRAFT_2164742 [Mycena galericulata]|nr:hypothetical protein B0H11DRAFT_2164742 [Mycena galericulata]
MSVPVTWNAEPFANLVLPANRKAGSGDFVKGKGAGLVVNLFGLPGVDIDAAPECKAFVLFKAPDVCLERRSLHNLERNADMIAVLSRHVKSYRGILFLPTACKPSVWRAFIARGGVRNIADDQVVLLARRGVNRRQIKNPVRIAHSIELGPHEVVALR